MKTYHVVVFKDKAGGGNPAPVTVLADELTTEQMQAMAKEFGQESAFLLKPTRPDCDVKARYFVPLHEMEMCVHDTVGSTFVLVDQGLVTKSPIYFDSHYGPMRVDWERENGKIYASVSQFLPKVKKEAPTTEELCKALGITPEELGEGPVESVATSRYKLIVPLVSKDVVYNLQPDFEYLWNLCDKYDTTGFYVFAQAAKTMDNVTFYARQFPKRAGYNEDPATGVAASALGAYLVLHELAPVREGLNRYTIYQGEAMGRPSIIDSEIIVENGKITATKVRGTAEYERK